jgi:hypothetical protein
MLRLTASLANALGVQWLTGCSEACGLSQARATICTTCSVLKKLGVPRPERSHNIEVIRSLNCVSLTPAASASASWVAAPNHLCRHKRTWPLSNCNWRLIWVLLAPEATAKISCARLTKRCGFVLRRTICLSRVCCLSDRIIGVTLGLGTAQFLWLTPTLITQASVKFTPSFTYSRLVGYFCRAALGCKLA